MRYLTIALALLTLLAQASPQARPVLTLSSPAGIIYPGDTWDVTATLTAPADGIYDLALVETPSAELLAADASGTPAFCPERGYCRMALTSGQQVVLTGHYRAAALTSGTSLTIRAWSDIIGGGAAIGTAERPAATCIALPVIGGP